jgi:hypothetical protein
MLQSAGFPKLALQLSSTDYWRSQCMTEKKVVNKKS